MNMLRETMVETGTVIAAITETHLSSCMKEAEAHIEGFNIYRADRAGRPQGGVAMYVSDAHSAHTVVLTTGSNGVVEYLALHIKSLNMIAAVIYRPPVAQMSDFAPVVEEVKQKILDVGDPQLNVIVFGDFNFPGADWSSSCPLGGTRDQRTQASVLFELRDELLLNQIIEVPTRADSILDLVFLSDESIIMNVDVRDTLMTDHRIILMETTLGFPDIKRSSFNVEESLSSLNFFSPETQWDHIVEKTLQISIGGKYLKTKT